MKRISQKEILSLSWEDLSKLSTNDLYMYAKESARYAKERRTKLINGLIEKNLPLPPSLQRWTTKNEIPDPFNYRNDKLSQVIGYNSYDKGYGNVDFTVSRDMEKNELLHKINLSKKFITSETSTISNWETYYRGIISRISSKSNTAINPSDYPLYWDLYNKVKEISRKKDYLASQFEYGKSFEIQEKIASYMMDRGFTVERANELAIILENEMQELYENEEEDYEDNDGFWF